MSIYIQAIQLIAPLGNEDRKCIEYSRPASPFILDMGRNTAREDYVLLRSTIETGFVHLNTILRPKPMD